jgi:superfamily II DNA or RNA helicase
MITIERDNSYSRITGLSPAQEKALKTLLSYEVGDHFSRFGPKRKSLLERGGLFPSGLYRRVLNSLKFEVSNIVDKRIKPKPSSVDFMMPEAYPSQIDALDAALHYGRGIISMPTGSGKSMVIRMIAGQLGLKTLVVTPNVGIKTQLQDTLRGLENVTVLNIDSPELKKVKGYDCIIIDEAHHSAASTYQKLNKTAWKDIYYRFFITATPFRNNDDETLLFEAIAGGVIYELSYLAAIKAGYIVPVEAYYIDIPKQKYPADRTWAQVYSDLVVNNEVRNGVIAYALAKLHDNNEKTLALVKEVKHGDILSYLSGFSFVRGYLDESRDFIHQFNSGEISTLIGTTGMIGEGIDTKPCEYVLICGLGKAKSQFMQQVGRAVRQYPGKTSAKIVIFRDTSHKFTLRHYQIQRKILIEQYGAIPIKLEF